MAFYQVEEPWTGTLKDGDRVLFSSGGVAAKCEVSSGALVSIGPKGAASATSVCNGGYMEFQSGSLPGKDNKVLSGGVLSIGLGTEPGNIDAANGAILQLTMGGIWFVQRPTDYTVTSNGTAIKKTGTSSSTSNGIVYAGYTGWDMKTSGCTLNIVDYASAAFVKVSSGCRLGLGGGHGYGAGAAGQIDVYNGGSAVLEKANYVGLATVHSGGSMVLGAYSENTTVMENGGYLRIVDESILLPDLYPDYDLNVKIKPNTFKDLVLSGYSQWATAHSGTVASHVTLKNSATLEVFHGGRAVNTVLSSGYLIIESGGIASGVSVEGSAYITVSGGGRITGKLNFGSGSVFVEDGGIVDFDISALKGNKDALLTGYNQFVLNSGELRNTITVSGETQTKGTYALATKAYSLNPNSDYRSEQQKIFAICDTSGTKLGAVMVGTKAMIGDQTYALNLNGSGDLSLTVAAYVEGDEIWTESGNDADNGWNDLLFYPRSKELHENVRDFKSTPVNSTTGAILFDKALSRTVNKVAYKNYAGEDDGADYAKITLTKPAKVSFTVNATDSAKFTIWELIPGRNDTYTKRSVKSVSTKKASKQSDVYTVTTDPVLLYEGMYYVSVEASTKKGHQAYYNVTVNQSDSVYFTKGDNSDDWDDLKEEGAAGHAGANVAVTAASKVIVNDWVGFGDEVDYRKITLASAAKLSFDIESTDVVKFSLCKLNAPDRKGDYSLKTLQSTTLKLGKKDTSCDATTKAVLLDAGVYYLCMQSTNAAKGGNAEYSVSLDHDDSVFYDKADNGANNWLFDKKKENPRNMQVAGAAATVIKSTTTAVQIDKAGMVNVGGKKNFVGYGDDTDFARFSVVQNAKVSFSVNATDAAKITVWQLVAKTDKKGKTTYSVKKVQSTTLKKGKGETEYATTTKGVQLDAAGDYYLSVESSNAKKGGSAYYNVSLESFEAVAAKDKDALPAIHEMAYVSPEHDAVCPGVVPETAGVADAVFTDAAADSGVVSLSSADLVGLGMSGAGDPAVSPIPVPASDDLFAGLADAASVAEFTRNDAVLTGQSALLA